MIRVGYQYQDLDNKALYLPKHLLEKPRGYHFQYQTRQQWAFKTDYALPLLSPDWSIGSLIYIRRLRANLFMIYRAIKPVLKVGGVTKVHTEAI